MEKKSIVFSVAVTTSVELLLIVISNVIGKDDSERKTT
jgi:hypothetical protein